MHGLFAGPCRTTILLAVVGSFACERSTNSSDSGDARVDAGSGDALDLDTGYDPDSGVDAALESGLDVASDGVPIDSTVDGDGAPGDVGPPFSQVVIRSTHNSYSGGARGPILMQLDRGIRFVEFDVHDNDFGAQNYRIGHLLPGAEVDHSGGNPASDRLSDWLAQVSAWSSTHRTHVPITVAFDLKDSLADNPSYAEGNLARFNELLTSTFGSRLFQPAAVGTTWPSIDALRGRVVAVISGSGVTRAGYLYDRGASPAVAINARGQIVEVHDSGAHALWYWTGEYLPSGEIRWHRHGQYDRGQVPSVALSDAGYIVEVHQGDLLPRLWYRVGRLGADYEIAWSPGVEFDSGVMPTLRFTDTAGTQLREVHRSEATSQNWFWNGRLDTTSLTVRWDSATHATTTDARYENAVATLADGRRVAISTGADGAAPSNTLRYSTDRVGPARVRYDQVAFVEYQAGDGADLREGAWYYAATSSDSSFIVAARRANRLVRGWGFNDISNATDPPMTFPATDMPFAAWYLDYCARVRAYE